MQQIFLGEKPTSGRKKKLFPTTVVQQSTGNKSQTIHILQHRVNRIQLLNDCKEN
jgi:hypothetical protein